MTKYSIKIRRNSLTKGKIKSHMDFKSLQQTAVKKEKSGVSAQLLIIVFAIILILSMIIFGVQKTSKKPAVRVPTEEVPDVFDEFKH